MIDINAARYDLSPEEEYAIKWFNENEFDGKITKQFISKTKFSVSKNGVTDNFEITPSGIPDIKAYMEMYGKQFELLCELRKLKAEK